MDGYRYNKEKTTAGYYDENDRYVSIGTTYSDDKLHFQFPQRGAEIGIYYNCIPVNHMIKHLDYDTNEEIVDPEVKTALYSSTVTAEALTAEQLVAKDKSHYNVYGSNSMTKVINHQEADNIFVFRYRERQVTYHYISVVKPTGYTDFGAVSLSRETVKVSSGTATGSTALENEAFHFTGWYLDRDCTKPVKESEYNSYLSEDDKGLKPLKDTNQLYDEEQTMFYALFEPNIANLTITKSGADD